MCQLFVKLLVKCSISMYIMYVILCLFSSLGRREGALQISIIIIDIIIKVIEADVCIHLT